jgi:hypothetical protein
MEGRVTANVGLAPLAALLLMALAGESLNPVYAREEANCLAAPGAQAPAGRHWFFRIDRTKQHKCWYLRAQAPAEATARVSAKPSVRIASVAPEAKSPAGSDQLVAAIRLEPYADQPAAAAPDNRAQQPSMQDGADASRKADADIVTGPAAAAPGLPLPDARLGRAAQSSNEGRIRQAHAAPATAAKADADADDGADVDRQAGDANATASSGRVSPLALLLAGAMLVIAGIFLHRIVQIFARRPVVQVGRAAPASMTSFAGEWKGPGFLARWREARLDRREYHLDEI